MAYRHDIQDHGEYGGGQGGNYRLPDGSPRSLSPGERARLLRSEGINGVPSPDAPREYGEELG